MLSLLSISTLFSIRKAVGNLMTKTVSKTTLTQTGCDEYTGKALAERVGVA
jgi:hypothetical protein